MFWSDQISDKINNTMLTSSILANPELFLVGFEVPAAGLAPGSSEQTQILIGK